MVLPWFIIWQDIVKLACYVTKKYNLGINSRPVFQLSERGLGSKTLQGHLHDLTNRKKIYNDLVGAVRIHPFKFLVDTLWVVSQGTWFITLYYHTYMYVNSYRESKT